MMKRVLLVFVLVGLGVLATLFLSRNAIVSAIARSQAEAHGVHCETLALSLSSFSDIHVAPTRCTFDVRPGVVLDLPNGARLVHASGRIDLVAVPRMVLTLDARVEDFAHVAEALLASERELPSTMREPVNALAQLGELSDVPYTMIDQLRLQRGTQPMLHLAGIAVNKPSGPTLIVSRLVSATVAPAPLGVSIVGLVVEATRDEVDIAGSVILEGPLTGPLAALEAYRNQTFRITGRDLRTDAPTYALDLERPAIWQAIEPFLRRALSGH